MSDPDPRSAAQEPIRQVQRAAAALAARLKPLASVRTGSANALGDLERALEALGDIATFATALQDTADQGRALLREGRANRAELLRTAIAGFIRRMEQDKGARETALGWRVGRLAIEVRSEDGTVRVNYNRQPVTAWQPAADVADVVRIYGDAEALLDKSEVQLDRLATAISSSYDYLAGRPETGHGSTRRVKLLDMLAEVRIVLAREAMQARKRKDAEAAIAMPIWSLLYNADRYRAAAASLPAANRLMFETGTTAEGEKFGVTLNGLDPHRDYQLFCYVRRVSE